MTKITPVKRQWTVPTVRRIDAQSAQGGGFSNVQDNLLPNGS